MKWLIIIHIRLCKTTKETWDKLSSLYHACNLASIALLHKEFEKQKMGEDDFMDAYLTKIKGLNEQLIFMDEIILQSSIVQKIHDGLLDSY